MFFILLDFQKDNVEQWYWRNKTHLHPRIPQNLSSESESGQFSIRCFVVNYQKFSCVSVLVQLKHFLDYKHSDLDHQLQPRT